VIEVYKPKWIKIKPTNERLSFASGKPEKWTINLSKENFGQSKDTVLHELGHTIMHEYTFGSHLKKVSSKPSFEESAKYAVTTYRCSDTFGEAPSEGWAESFHDYFTRPQYLKKHSPKLHTFWSDVIKENPEIRKMVKSLNKDENYY